MSSIADRIKEINASLPQGTRLVAVSKFHPAEAIQEAYDAGHRLFGENKVQELVAKKNLLPSDISWHFIGHLQTNKVKMIVPFVALIHSVDTEHLLKEIDKQAAACGRTIECLLEVHVAREETKFGFSPEEVRDLFANGAYKAYEHVKIVGIMGMASHVDDEGEIRKEFHALKTLFDEVKNNYAPAFRELSMGMSGDYHIAVEEGSTLVRIGTYIFGERLYV